MKLFLVLDETRFHQPGFVAEFLRRTPDNVVGAALVTKILPRNNSETYLRRHFYVLRPRELGILASRQLFRSIMDRLRKPGTHGAFYSVRSALKAFGVEFREAHFDINRPEYLAYIREKDPDLILSSNSLIFGEALLRLPKLVCLNRHCALLPSYAGLLPVFQALRSGEPVIGTSVHIMERRIDRGAVLAKEEITVEANDTVDDLYAKCFAASVPVCLQAIDKVRAGDLTPVETRREPSYFTFPKREHWQELRRRGRRFI